jgi:hypothetical protein
VGSLGGGLRWERFSSGAVINTVFAHNMASKGSAIYVDESASVDRVQSCLFFNNSQAEYMPQYGAGGVNPLIAFQEESLSIFTERCDTEAHHESIMN